MGVRRNGAVTRLTISAMLTALGVVILWLGAVVDVLDITMAAMASFLTVFAVIELQGKYPYLIFAATALLSLLFLPVKTPALLYALFAGYYPMLKALLEGHLKKPLAWVLKIVIFNAALALAIFLILRLFTVDGDSLFTKQYWLLLIGTPVFVLYDVALTRLITTYLHRWRRHFKFLHRP